MFLVGKNLQVEIVEKTSFFIFIFKRKMVLKGALIRSVMSAVFLLVSHASKDCWPSWL